MKNIKKKKDAYVIGETYSLFPKNNMRFESTQLQSGIAWGFFANKSNRTQVHIKYDSAVIQDNWT